MQYQVFKEETGDLVAWVDTDSNEGITFKGYKIRMGDNLKCVEVPTYDEDDVKVAKFERVSFEQYLTDADREDTITTYGTAMSCYSKVRLPLRKTNGSAGYDFFAPHGFIIPAHGTVFIPTGIKVKMAPRFELEIFPRSSLGRKYKLTIDNTVGIIDGDYYNNEDNEGHILMSMTNNSDKDLCLKEGDSYCQGIIHRYYTTDNDVAPNKKRVGGYGSTGR